MGHSGHPVPLHDGLSPPPWLIRGPTGTQIYDMIRRKPSHILDIVSEPKADMFGVCFIFGDHPASGRALVRQARRVSSVLYTTRMPDFVLITLGPTPVIPLFGLCHSHLGSFTLKAQINMQPGAKHQRGQNFTTSPTSFAIRPAV